MLCLLVCLLSVTGGLTALTPDEIELCHAQEQFATNLFNAISGNSSLAENIFFSPYSIYNALLTLYVASAGKTEKSLEKFLRFKKDSKPSKEFITNRLLNESLTGHSKEYELVSLDRLYHSKDIKVKPDKIQKFAKKIIEFKTTDKRADEINTWISKTTKGLITNLFKSIGNGSVIISANAAYFKGFWEVPLTGKQTKKAFTLPDGTTRETLFMSGPQDLLFQSLTDPELNSQILNLPYKGDYLSMFIILPTKDPKSKTPPPVSDVVKKLTNTKFQSILDTLRHQNSVSSNNIMIPKFKAKGQYKLNEIFKAMGGEDLFGVSMDLTNIFESNTLTIDKILHMAKVNVFENGTEAAASTVIETNSATEQVFCADHPFIYIIYSWPSFIHYMGVLNDPEQTNQ